MHRRHRSLFRAIAKASPGEAAAVEKNLKHDDPKEQGPRTTFCWGIRKGPTGTITRGRSSCCVAGRGDDVAGADSLLSTEEVEIARGQGRALPLVQAIALAHSAAVPTRPDGARELRMHIGSGRHSLREGSIMEDPKRDEPTGSARIPKVRRPRCRGWRRAGEAFKCRRPKGSRDTRFTA
jgi:hypothetical protein